jgi:hypothetical protein
LHAAGARAVRHIKARSPLHRHRPRARSADQTSKIDDRRRLLKPDEIRKLDAYFKRVFQNPKLEVKARPRKDDSAEVYVGDEFLGIVFKDEDDGDYNFSMAILDIDLA